MTACKACNHSDLLFYMNLCGKFLSVYLENNKKDNSTYIINRSRLFGHFNKMLKLITTSSTVSFERHNNKYSFLKI